MFSIGVLLFASAIAFSGCATRQYVKHQVGAVEPQIAEVRDAQAQQAERIDVVDRRVMDAQAAADRAGTSAANAAEKAMAADRRAAEADRRANTAQQTATSAMNRVDAFENEIANLDKYSLADQKTVTFNFDSDLLSNEAISRLDDIAGSVSTVKAGYLIELRGFTDSIGTEKYNFRLSERRAESVQRYLVSKDVPLHRIVIVGLGKLNAGYRQQNRKVEIRVLRSGSPVAAATR
jgi:outer membrane protein OmpA-like peptidoglycan-associated protein